MTLAPPGYELVEELGRGATGVVHLARHVASGREVAIKRIVGGASSQDPETVLRFEREARLLQRLDHPGIVRIHELIRVGADLFLVMDHVPGTDLRRTLAAGPPAPDVAARYVAEIAAALDHAHGRGLVHRGLEPSNVLVRPDGGVEISDFGLAALVERQALSRTGPAGAMDGLAYLAPELARGDLSVDRRADVYSLGVIAYEMLVGRVPFPVDPSDPYATVRAQMQDLPPRPGRLVPGFPPLLEGALLWGLEKLPERRPATAGELAAALREGLEQRPTIGAYTESARRPRASDARPAAAEYGPPEMGRPAMRWRVPVALALAGVVAATAVVIIAGLVRSPAPAPPALQVTAVTAAEDPPNGVAHCAAAAIATLTLRATVFTNGAAGTLAYQWLRPDGRPDPPARVVMRAGRRSATVTLSLGYSGNAAVQGVGALHVLAPASVYSEPLRISYSCP
jgi:Protein kinase domain